MRRLWLSNKAGNAAERKEMNGVDNSSVGGIEFSIETGKIAKQANGAVIVR
jgi:hypothetical protein